MAGLEGTSFGDFEILEKLGEGGMGAVYKARQGMLDRLTALKVMSGQLGMDETFVRRFIREAAAAANLSHPNMVQVYKCGEIDGIHYIAMEYVEGESLHDRLTRSGRLDAREAIAVAVYVAQALQYAWNRAHLIHRDIKPDNIFLSKTGEVKVGDLGLAKIVGTESVELTRTGMMVGSPHYVSPEQARGLRDLDFRADIYSLGCTLYHMLAGRTPYEGTDAMGIMMRHVNDPPPAIFKVWPQCPVPLALALGRMMAKDRSHRHASYEELIEDLLSVRDKLTSGATPAVAAPPQPAVLTPPRQMPSMATPGRGAPPAKGKPALPMPALAGAAAAVLAIAGLLFWAPWQARGPQPSAAGPDGALADAIAALPPEEQFARVLAALRERNPGFDPSTADYLVENGQMVGLSLDATGLSDIGALASLRQLRSLDCSGRMGAPSALRDLSPLRGLPLTRLKANWTAVEDLAPLRGMPLEELFLKHAPVADLAPLGGTGLKVVDLSGTAVRDLSPLAGLPLYNLHLHDCGAVADLAPLRDMKLAVLCVAGTPVADFSPLRDMPLRSIACSEAAARSPDNIGILRSLPALQTINNRPVAKYWDDAAAARPEDAPPTTAAPVDADGFRPLFDSQTLAGWNPKSGAPSGRWIIRDGALVNAEPNSYLVTGEEFGNFTLRCEFNVGPGADGGVFLRGLFQIQITDDAGGPAGSTCSGALLQSAPARLNATRPAGEWQQLEATIIGRAVTVTLNGTRVVDAAPARTPSGGRLPRSDENSGPVMLEGWKGAVAFRNIRIWPLGAAQLAEQGQYDGVSVTESAAGDKIPHPLSRKTQDAVLADLAPTPAPDGMVFIPEGRFPMGTDSGNAAAFPQHDVEIKAFFIDKFEVTNAQYLEYVRATGHPVPTHWARNGGRIPPGRANHPVTEVSWDDAKAYCDWCGKRLPTEAEWEKAASWDAALGVKRSTPWGAGGDADPRTPRMNWSARWVDKGEDQHVWDAFTKTDAYKKQMALGGPTVPVGSFPLGASPSGCLDMAGNAWEWTADWFDKYPDNTKDLDPVDAPQCGGHKARVLRGVACDCHPLSGGVQWCANRRGHEPNWRRWHIGFRCAMDCPQKTAAAAP